MEICLVMRNNLKRSLRHKIRWAIIFFMPLLLSPCMSLINQIRDNTYRVGVINLMSPGSKSADNRSESVESICSILNENPNIKAQVASVDTYHTDLILGTYQYIIDASKGISEEAVISTKTKKDNQEFYQLVLNGSLKESVPQNEREKATHLTMMQQSVGFLMSLFLIMSVLQGGMYQRDKNQGLVERYCYAPKKKKTYLVGNLCFIFFVTLLQVLASFLLLCTVNGTWLSVKASILIIALVTVVASVVAMILCAICSNDTQAGISASTIAAFLMMISGMFVTVDRMPQVLQFMSKFDPVRWCMELVKF
ncbi:MAG: ABC transporter permease [Clostridiales bacterium]|nr:ABC transporter permease [Clostridiales bacterium]